MNPQQIKEDLFKGLNNTVNENVVLNVAHVIQCIGIDQTDEIMIWCKKMTSTPNIKKKVLKKMPLHKRTIVEGYGCFNRLQLLELLHSTPLPTNATTSNTNT